MDKARTIEQRVVDTILERSTESLTLDGVTYEIAPPTLATLIMASELVATLPKIDETNENLLEEVMRKARDCRVIGRITAVLILGAKRVLEQRQVKAPEKKRSYFGRILHRLVHKSKNGETVAEVDRLAEIVLNEVSPATLQSILTKRILDMQIADFFALTTSLTTANQLKPTREVDEATVFGE
jgi:hypothetical protein